MNALKRAMTMDSKRVGVVDDDLSFGLTSAPRSDQFSDPPFAAAVLEGGGGGGMLPSIDEEQGGGGGASQPISRFQTAPNLAGTLTAAEMMMANHSDLTPDERTDLAFAFQALDMDGDGVD